MPNGPVHRAAAALALGAVHTLSQDENSELGTDPLLSSVGGFGFGTLPDLIEPATSPAHRKFFHSFAALAAVGYAGYKLYEWRPDQKRDCLLRQLGLVVLASYGLHLLLDSQTPAGLPLI